VTCTCGEGPIWSTEWIEANGREDRAPHKYALEDFDLVRSDVEQSFAAYRAAFLEGK
jgi:hypothetical protein